jgi:hypothetical protein
MLMYKGTGQLEHYSILLFYSIILFYYFILLFYSILYFYIWRNINNNY